MNLFKLEEMMISVSDIKKQLSEVVNNNLTKIIMKNNTPKSVILPYDEYVKLVDKIFDKEPRNEICNVLDEIRFDNGVTLMVKAEKQDNEIAIKTYKKMKTSGDYKLYHEQHLSVPRY